MPARKPVGKPADQTEESRDLFEAVPFEDQIPGNHAHSTSWVEIPLDDPSLHIARTLYPPPARRSVFDARGLRLMLGAVILAAGGIGLFMLARGGAPASSPPGASAPPSASETASTQGAQDLPAVLSPAAPSASPAETLSRAETPSLNGRLPIATPEGTASPLGNRPGIVSPPRDRPTSVERAAPASPPPVAAPRGAGTSTASPRREPPASQPWRPTPSMPAAPLRPPPAALPRERAVPEMPAAPAPAPTAAAAPAAESITPPPTAPAPPVAVQPAPQTPSASPPVAAPQATTTPAAAAPSTASAGAPAAELALAADERRVRGVIERYRAAYSALDVGAVRAVWPKVNARALGRAFDQLATQQIDFAGCDISIAGERASAGCSGNAEFVTKVGSRTPRLETRTWSFELRKTGSQWTIEAVESH